MAVFCNHHSVGVIYICALIVLLSVPSRTYDPNFVYAYGALARVSSLLSSPQDFNDDQMMSPYMSLHVTLPFIPIVTGISKVFSPRNG